MSLFDWLKKIAVKVDSADNPIFKISVEDQEKYIKHLREPQNDIDRSYFQYKCQMRVRGRMQTALLNLGSLPLYLYYMIIGKDNKDEAKSSPDAVFMREGRPENILPPSILNRFSSIEYNPKVSIRLSREDKRFIRAIWRKHPFSWLFLFKILIKVGRYSYVIRSYRPSSIIVAAEYSYTSSVLTRYCNEIWNVKHINVQHGEKLYTIWDSFFRFDEMYVWEKYYKNLLISLRADEKQFRVELPPSMTFTDSVETNKRVDYCYYLAAESKEELQRIHNALTAIRKRGNIVIIRPHPRYSDKDLINEVFNDIQIEDAKNTSIEESICRTKYAIALFSTVLNQAFHNGTGIVIDDISNLVYFEKLKEMKYICLQYEHNLLSQVVGAINEN